eukprot:3204047-Pleurochrysis_carterae.AAC.1
MYHSIQQLNACEVSPLKVRERCVSRIADKRLELRAKCSQKSSGRPPRGKAESQGGSKKKPRGGVTKSEKPKEAEKTFIAGKGKSRWFARGMGVRERKRRSSTAPAA